MNVARLSVLLRAAPLMYRAGVESHNGIKGTACMYDTVAAILGEVPPSVLDRRRWDHVREVTDLRSGEVSRRATLNADGLLLTLHGDGSALKAERSLPKVYRGQNVDDLIGPEVAVALGEVDGEIADALGTYDLPSIGEWTPVRVDYPWSLRLRDEGEVNRTLDKWAGLEMPYKGLPVVGQSASVTWSKGDIRLKAYSKFRETQFDRRAAGVLRVEPGVFRVRTFRKLLGLDGGADVRLLDVLTPAMHGIVRDKFAGRLLGDVMTAKELGDMALFNEMLGLFGSRRTATLLGWALMWALKGVESREGMLAIGLGSLQTRYRVLADYRRFRAHLLAQGYVLSETGDETSDVEEIVHRIAASGMAA